MSIEVLEVLLEVVEVSLEVMEGVVGVLGGLTRGLAVPRTGVDVRPGEGMELIGLVLNTTTHVSRINRRSDIVQNF